MGAKGLPDKIAPVVIGAANMMRTIGVPETVGLTLMGVFIASFAGTTLDTSTRIQRYVVSELATELRIPFLANRWAATSFAVLTAAALAFATGADGTGAMKLWPLFGTSNQLLAALALLVVTFYLKRKGGLKYMLTAVPCLIMLVITNWAMVRNGMFFFSRGELASCYSWGRNFRAGAVDDGRGGDSVCHDSPGGGFSAGRGINLNRAVTGCWLSIISSLLRGSSGKL